MTALIRSVKNNLTTSLVLRLPGFDPTWTAASATIAVGATFDVLATFGSDILHTMQPELSALVSDGSVSVTGYIDLNAMQSGPSTWISAHNNKIVPNPLFASGTHAAGATLTFYMEDSSSVVNPYDSTDTVEVSATGGASGATNVTITGGCAVSAYQTVVTFAAGAAPVVITANAAGTVSVTLSNGPSGITVSGTWYATLS